MRDSPKIDGGVIVVDDEPAMVEVLTRVVNEMGFRQVFQASDGVEALSIISNHETEIDLVLLDLRMPMMSGFELIQHLANVHKQIIGIVMVTAYSSKDAEAQFYLLGSETIRTHKFFAKPFDIAILKGTIEEAFGAISRKRKEQLRKSDQVALQRSETLEVKLTHQIKVLELKLDRLDAKVPTFLQGFGLDLIRLVIFGLAVLALFYLGLDDFLKRILK